MSTLLQTFFFVSTNILIMEHSSLLITAFLWQTVYGLWNKTEFSRVRSSSCSYELKEKSSTKELMLNKLETVLQQLRISELVSADELSRCSNQHICSTCWVDHRLPFHSPVLVFYVGAVLGQNLCFAGSGAVCSPSWTPVQPLRHFHNLATTQKWRMSNKKKRFRFRETQVKIMHALWLITEKESVTEEPLVGDWFLTQPSLERALCQVLHPLPSHTLSITTVRNLPQAITDVHRDRARQSADKFRIMRLPECWCNN